MMPHFGFAGQMVQNPAGGVPVSHIDEKAAAKPVADIDRRVSMDGDFSHEETLMVKAAWYYYMENYTQQNISTLLGVSRVRVIRLLEKARQDGIISFHIRQ